MDLSEILQEKGQQCTKQERHRKELWHGESTGGGTYRAQKLVLVVLCSVLFAGCAKREEIVKTFSQSEEDGICATYYERKDGTWECGGTAYQHRLELKGRLPNAESDSCFVVLTDNENLTFEEVAKSLYGSLIEDSRAMEDSVIVEMQ